MRKSMVVFIALVLLAAGGAAWAADSNTLTVQASVVGTCMFTGTKTSTLDFGAIDPSAAGPIPASGSTQFWCTKGVTTDAISAGNGGNHDGTSRRMAGPGGDFIPYSLILAAPSGTNAGPLSPRTLNFSGSIVAADYAVVSAGSYSDTVTLTLTP